MPSFRLSPIFNDAQLDDDGTPLTGGMLHWYIAGTTTPTLVYRTEHGVSHANPVVLNARGEPPAPIWLSEGTKYKAILKTPQGVTIRVIDDIIGVGDVSTAPSTFEAITIDSTGNGGVVYQSESGHITLGSNNRTGTKNTFDVGGGRSKSSAPVIAPAARFGDSTLPTEKLEVAGNVNVEGALTVNSDQDGVGPVRTALTADRTYYVRTDGADSNDGGLNNANRAFRTLARALAEIETLDLGNSNVTIDLADGTYTGSVTLPQIMGSGQVTIRGNTTTPASVVIVGTESYVINSVGPGNWLFSGFRYSNAAGSGIRVAHGVVASMVSIEYGACLYDQMLVDTGGYCKLAGGATTIVAGGQAWIHCTGGGYFTASAQTVTITGTPAYSWAFAATRRNSTIDLSGSTFVGTATGSSYHSSQKAVLITPPGGISDIPGDGTGTAADSGSVTGGDAQPASDILTEIATASLTTTNRLLALRTVGSTPTLTEWDTGTITPSLLAATDKAAVQAVLDLEPGIDVQAQNGTLSAIAAMTTNATPAVPAVATTSGTTTATRLVVGTDLQGYTARLDALKTLLDTLATAGPVDPETELPTPLSCLLRYGTAGLVEADTTPYAKAADLTGFVTSTTLDSAIATLEADIAATYLTTAQGDDRYIERTEETSILSNVYGTDFTADSGTQPFFSAALNTGTIVGSGSNDAQAGHHGLIKFVSNATATANSGYRVWTGRTAIWMSGGQWFQLRFNLPSVTDVSTRIGFFDQNLFSSTVTNGVYFDIVNATATAYTTAASTSSSSVYGTALAINTWYRADLQFVAGGDLVVLKLYNDDTGALLFQAGFDTNLPLNAKCGAGVISVATTAVSSKDVILLDSMHYKARA